MNRRFVVAKLKGSQDVSGIILPEGSDRAQLLQRGAELLPYFPPEREQIRLAS
jgi:hypothetical protein